MRTGHKPHSLPTFPVYSSAFLSDDVVVLGGGGGASRSGIKNRLRLYNIGTNKSLDLVDEFELETGEDAPMSMATHPKSNTIICGVNSTQEKLEKGQNENCRVFGIKENKLALLRTQGTLLPGTSDDYQKVTTLSPDGLLLAVAGSHDVSLLSLSSLSPVAQPIHTENEIYDVTFSSTALVVATTLNLLVYALPTQPLVSSPDKATGKGKSRKKKAPSQQAPTKLELLKSVDIPPTLGNAAGSVFRSARYNPVNGGVLYTVINSSSPRTRKTRTPQRLAFVCKWNTEGWIVEKTRKVGDRNLTCFDISADGKFLAFGSSDLTIGFLDATTLNPFVNILKAHEFPPTTIAFNPTSTLLVSGSADNSVRIIAVPQSPASGSSWRLILLLITICLLLLAVIIPTYIGPRNLSW